MSAVVRSIAGFVLTLAAVVAWVPVAALQVQQEEFQPATQLGEQLPAAPLVFYAYAFCWLALLAYVFLLWQRLRRAQREIDEVSAKWRT
jgi:CcmD family protein